MSYRDGSSLRGDRFARRARGSRPALVHRRSRRWLGGEPIGAASVRGAARRRQFSRAGSRLSNAFEFPGISVRRSRWKLESNRRMVAFDSASAEA
jgi:hypothetical protein